MRKFRDYRPALAAFLLMMSMALTTTALSFFVVPVCTELGLGRGSFTVYYSLMTAAGAIAAPVLGQSISKRGVRRIVGIGSVWGAVGFVAFSFSGALWMFYGAGVFLGIFGTACVSLCATVVVQQNYAGTRASGILGVVMAGSGVGGMLVSLILPGVIQELGWRWGYRFVAVCWLIFGLLALSLLEKQAMPVSKERQQATSEGMTRAQALGSLTLYLLILMMFLLSAATGIQQHIPSVLAERGLRGGAVSAMVSFFTAMLALGKIGQGLLYGKAGAVRGGTAVIAVFAGSFVMLLSENLIWPGLAALAVGMGSVTTLIPILTRNAFGTREYAAIWSILSAVSNFGAMVAAPLFGVVYDGSGTYGPAMLVSALGLVLTMVTLKLCFRKSK